MTDRLKTYTPSFILAAATEFIAAAMLLILFCDKKKPLHNRSHVDNTAEDGELCELDDVSQV